MQNVRDGIFKVKRLLQLPTNVTKKKKKQQRYEVKTGTGRAASLKMNLLYFLKSTENKYLAVTIKN